LKRRDSGVKKQNFLEGALILSVSAIIVKIIGGIFRIPLAMIIGDSGMGYYGVAYNIFTMVLSVATSGLTVAVSKLVAEYVVKRRYRDVKKIGRISTLIFTVTGIVGTVAIMAFARPLTGMLAEGNMDGYLAVIAIAPAVFFLCLMSSYRGYYTGLRNMMPTAVSQVVEALVKLFLALGLSYGVQVWGTSQYNATGKVFGRAISIAPNSSQGEISEILFEAMAPYMAAAAILGVTISTLFGLLYLIYYNKRHSDGVTKEDVLSAPKASSSSLMVKRLLGIAIPICLGSLAVSLASMIDTLTIQPRLNDAIAESPEVFMEMYGDLITNASPLDALANKLYGAYSGRVSSVFNLIPTITATLGVSILPAITSSWAQGNKRETKANVESALRITSLIAMPSGFALLFMASPILELIFGKVDTIPYIAPILSLMGISVIFVSLASPINAILQAVGKVSRPMIYTFIGAVLKLACNYILLGIPTINIQGIAVGTLFNYAFIIVAGLITLLRTTKVKLHVESVFIKPAVAGLVCGLSGFLANSFLQKFLHYRLATMGAVGIAVIVYAGLLLLLKGIQKEDVLLLPKGEKISKTLEKYGLIG